MIRALAVLVLCAVVTFPSAVVAQPQACELTSDCPSGLVCKGRICQPEQPIAPTVEPPEEIAPAKVDVAPPAPVAPGGSCTDSSECASGAECDGGVCRLTCDQSADCPSGTGCHGGLCRANPVQVSPPTSADDAPSAPASDDTPANSAPAVADGEPPPSNPEQTPPEPEPAAVVAAELEPSLEPEPADEVAPTAVEPAEPNENAAVRDRATCRTDEDCSAGSRCDDGVCLPRISVQPEAQERPVSNRQTYARPSGPVCRVDADCGAGVACEGGVCRAATDRAAESACGHDRRCRLALLKEKNNARRRAEQARISRQAEQQIAASSKSRLKRTPRRAAPWTVGLQYSRIANLPGVYAGYTLNGVLRFGLDYQNSEFDSFENPRLGFTSIHWITGAVEFLVLEGTFAPYVRGGFKFGTGETSPSGFGFESGEFFGPGDLEVHALEVGGGIDMQLPFGLHAKLAVVYRPKIYSQVSVGPAIYDPLLLEEFDNLYGSDVAIDVIGALGWAF